MPLPARPREVWQPAVAKGHRISHDLVPHSVDDLSAPRVKQPREPDAAACHRSAQLTAELDENSPGACSCGLRSGGNPSRTAAYDADVVVEAQ